MIGERTTFEAFPFWSSIVTGIHFESNYLIFTLSLSGRSTDMTARRDVSALAQQLLASKRYMDAHIQIIFCKTAIPTH